MGCATSRPTRVAPHAHRPDPVRPHRAEYEGLARSVWNLLGCERLDAATAARARGLYYLGERGVRVVVCTPNFWGEVWDGDGDRAAAIRSTHVDAGVMYAYSTTGDLRLVERRAWPDDLVDLFAQAGCDVFTK